MTHETRDRQLRPAYAIDAEALFDIRCSVLQNYQSQEELMRLGITIQSVKQMIEGGDYITTIAEDNRQPVGFSMAQVSEGYLFACFVRPEFEDQGFGRALINAAEKGLCNRGVTRAWLSTGSEPGLRAIGFYLHLGWDQDGFLEDGQFILRKSLNNTEKDVSADGGGPRC